EEKTEKDEALIYSSQPLKNFDYFEKTVHDYLHTVEINGQNYPYDIRYANKPSLYIEDYPGEASAVQKPENLVDIAGNPITNTNDYSKYDIVVHIYFRDTVIAVQKELVLPTYSAADPEDPNSKEVPGMTDEQKLVLFDKLNTSSSNGYATTFLLTSPDEGFDFSEPPQTITITKRDPAGNYTAYSALGENPLVGHTYVVNEMLPEDPEGLVLKTVTFDVTRYSMGEEVKLLAQLVTHDVTTIDFGPDNENRFVSSKPILLGDNDIDTDGDTKPDKTVSVKIADVRVINTYVEKQTTIYYEAVGNGKVAIVPENGEPNFQDTPTETLAFYSGKAVGADVFAGAGATFVGWYTDPECKNPVELKHGVYDRNTGNFKPNSNIINADSVTFYAKFETNSVTIERTGGTPGQTYVYMVEGTDTKGTKTVMYATLTCGADGTGSTQILEAVSNSYKITEMGDWPWRSDNGVSVEQTQSFGDDDVNHIKVSFNGNEKIRTWSNGYSPSKKNVYSVSGGGSE
ncbi:MAG: hypothetical protein IKV40_05450, partial [Clostridia bacterium]|nr:hypothetical protein [Clostridia bacterium]